MWGRSSDCPSACARGAGRDCSEFSELAAIESALGRQRVLLDGELVCLGADGSPDFASLRRVPTRPPPTGAADMPSGRHRVLALGLVTVASASRHVHLTVAALLPVHERAVHTSTS
jgi:hypothetical protein